MTYTFFKWHGKVWKNVSPENLTVDHGVYLRAVMKTILSCMPSPWQHGLLALLWVIKPDDKSVGDNTLRGLIPGSDTSDFDHFVCLST